MAGFKKFIVQGDAVGIAVGIIMGIAFGTVVTAIVQRVIMPIIAGVVGKPNFDNVLSFTIGSNHSEVSIGAVITALVNFLLVAAAVYFFIVVPVNALKDRRKAKVAEPEELSNEERMVELLERIANK